MESFQDHEKNVPKKLAKSRKKANREETQFFSELIRRRNNKSHEKRQHFKVNIVAIMNLQPPKNPKRLKSSKVAQNFYQNWCFSVEEAGSMPTLLKKNKKRE